MMSRRDFAGFFVLLGRGGPAGKCMRICPYRDSIESATIQKTW